MNTHTNPRRAAEFRRLLLLLALFWALAALLAGCGGGSADGTDTQAALPDVSLPQLHCQQRRELCA